MSNQETAALQGINANDLYREEVFTDHHIGAIRRLTPVRSDGSADVSRTTIFVGQAQILTAGGSLPLSFDIPAQSLAEAVAKFSDAARAALDRALEELEAMQREAASSILVPEPGMGGFEGPGGLPGGGKIQLP